MNNQDIIIGGTRILDDIDFSEKKSKKISKKRIEESVDMTAAQKSASDYVSLKQAQDKRNRKNELRKSRNS